MCYSGLIETTAPSTATSFLLFDAEGTDNFTLRSTSSRFLHLKKLIHISDLLHYRHAEATQSEGQYGKLRYSASPHVHIKTSHSPQQEHRIYIRKLFERLVTFLTTPYRQQTTSTTQYSTRFGPTNLNSTYSTSDTHNANMGRGGYDTSDASQSKSGAGQYVVNAHHNAQAAKQVCR